MKVKIIPAILVKTKDEFEGRVRFFEQYFDVAQIDMMDGVFVDNLTYFNLDEVKKIETDLDYELHMMMERPEDVLDEWLTFKKVRRVIVHYEAFHKRKKDLYDIIDTVKKRGVQMGLAINPETSVSKAIEFLSRIDMVLVMGVNPGWSGQEFDRRALEKVSALRSSDKSLAIGVDGGVSEQTYSDIIRAGANLLSANSWILSMKDQPKKIEKLISEIS